MSLKQHFDLVCWYYQCTPDERSVMRDLARAKPDWARPSYAAMAAEIELWMRLDYRPDAKPLDTPSTARLL